MNRLNTPNSAPPLRATLADSISVCARCCEYEAYAAPCALSAVMVRMDAIVSSATPPARA